MQNMHSPSSLCWCYTLVRPGTRTRRVVSYRFVLAVPSPNSDHHHHQHDTTRSHRHPAVTARAMVRSLTVTFTVRLGPENDSDRPGSFTGNLKFKFKLTRLGDDHDGRRGGSAAHATWLGTWSPPPRPSHWQAEPNLKSGPARDLPAAARASKSGCSASTATAGVTAPPAGPGPDRPPPLRKLEDSGWPGKN